jgi:phage-related protein
MAIPTSELQKINPSAIIELFKVELNILLHGSSTVYRFHAGTNQLNGDIIWQGDTYERYPIQAEGFEYSGTGSLPRPTLTISNVFGFVSALIINTNKVTAKNDLQGAKFTRLRVLASSLDNANFSPVTSSSTTTTTIADPADAETVTYTVTVHNPGSGNIFRINGVNNPVITMKRGSTYIFDQSDATNSGHPLAIKSDAGGAQTTTVSGTAGNAGATVTYQPAYPTAPNDLRYYCTVHGNAMGNTITMNDPNTTTQETTTTTSSQTNPFGTPNANELPQEIYFIDRKVTENREFVQFECVSVLDLQGIRVPKRQVTRKDFDGVGTFINT